MNIKNVLEATPLEITIQSEETPLLLPQFQRRQIAGQCHILKLGKWHRVRFRKVAGQEAIPQPFPVQKQQSVAASHLLPWLISQGFFVPLSKISEPYWGMGKGE